ncbi:glycine receptor subunit alpha-3-like [Macrobrachium nipponense]|uniref:glycine receptor subunit alpha-3-like n=1 Tax=Macrobrachium nipponense TaxID=159736 RepID=UPI0030C836E5
MARLVGNLIVSAMLTWMGASAIKIRMEEIINLKENDGTLRPQNHGPTMVNVSLVLHSLVIDDKRQVLELSGDLHQEWDNPGLEFTVSAVALLGNSIPLTGISGRHVLEQLWRPDLTSAQEVRPGFGNHYSDFVRLSREGHVTWTQRVHYSFPCPLDLSGYPMGIHSCTLKLHSLGYQADELQPSWYGDAAVDYGGMTISHGYKLRNIRTSAKTVVTVHRTKRQLRVEMEIETASGWALKHTVIPMTATVTTAYLAFFINIRGVGARMITCMMSMVTAAIFHESAYSIVPPAAYTMALEVFTGTCLTFIFIATVESVVVDVLSHLPTKGRRSTPSPHTSFALEPDLTDERPGTRGQVAALWLDRCFRVLYPAAFLAFNAVYWVLYN